MRYNEHMRYIMMIGACLLLLTACTHIQQKVQPQEQVQQPDLSGIPYSYFVAVNTASEKFHPTTVPQGALVAPCNGFIVRQQQSAQEASSQGDLIAAAVSTAITADFDAATVYYNPLKKTDITLERVVVTDDEVQVFARGVVPAERCEEEQSALMLNKTVSANAPGRDVRIYLNDILWQ